MIGVQKHIVGNEIGVLDELLNHGVSAVLDLNDGAVVHLRSHVLVLCGNRGKREVSVQLRQHRGGTLNARALLGDKVAHV